MTIDYKKELETAAKGMILVHRPDLLIAMIVRTIVQKVGVSHAGILLHDRKKDTYVLTVSRGPTGLKIPAGFARLDNDNDLIRLFREYKYRQLFSAGFVYRQGQRLLKRRLASAARAVLKGALRQLDIFESEVCIPSYFRDDLLGILLLGEKNNGQRFKKEELNFLSALTSDVAMAIRNAQLFEELEAEIKKKHSLFIHTTIALAAAIDAKDHYTHGHTSRVTNLTLELARRLAQTDKKSFDDKFFEYLHIAGLLHDIGKIGIPEPILNKDGPLNGGELEKIKEHPVVGAAILQPIKELEVPIQGVRYHHERYDGSGYPEGLKGEQIPLIASIIAVVDAFDAMTTNRPYRRGLSKEEAIAEIRRQAGRQFNPHIAQVFVQLFEEGKI
jgi:HD-GYP domain-containing protein (c-di-GMP phosphodiesterase class II)